MLLGYEEGIGEGQGLYSSLINHQSPEYKAVARSLARSLPRSLSRAGIPHRPLSDCTHLPSKLADTEGPRGLLCIGPSP